MIAPHDLLIIVATALAVAVGVGLLGLLVLRLARPLSLLAQQCVVVLAAIASVVGGTVAIARAMYISPHDLAVLCWVIGVAALASLGLGLVLGRDLTRRSERLRSIARAVGDGRVVSAGPRGGGELADVARELAETSERLARARDEVTRLDDSRRQLVAWISHDLRTPLAALRAMAEALEDGMAEDPARYHRQIRGQADTLAGMVDDLFELSKIQSGTLSLTMEPLSLYDLVSDAVAELNPVARSRSVTLSESRTGNVTVWGDARELSRVIGNLLMNAIQHSPAGGKIHISARETGEGHVALSVTDEGGGIPEEDLGRIFEAGWRGTASRTPEPAGATATGGGFGLAIVEGIVRAHSGGVTVSNVPGGCRFDVTLPRGDRGAGGGLAPA